MNIKTLAWNFVLNNNISKLKISLDDIMKIAKKNGWHINSYNDSANLMKDLEIPKEHTYKKGFTYVFLKDKKIEYFIFFQNNLSYEEKIYVILHEIGHILAEHTYCGSILGKNNDDNIKNKQEIEADIFAFEVLAPSYILSVLRKDTAEGIKSVSMLSYKNSLKYVIELHKVNDDDVDDEYLKKRLLKQYKEYINNIEKKEFKNVISKNSFIKYVFKCFIALIIISVFVNVYQFDKNPKLKNQTKITDLSSTEEESQIDPSMLPSISELQIENTTLLESTSDSQDTDNYANEKTVYVTSSGKKYHLQNCRYVKNKTNIKELSIKDAIKIGYEPCSVCIR